MHAFPLRRYRLSRSFLQFLLIYLFIHRISVTYCFRYYADYCVRICFLGLFCAITEIQISQIMTEYQMAIGKTLKSEHVSHLRHIPLRDELRKFKRIIRFLPNIGQHSEVMNKEAEEEPHCYCDANFFLPESRQLVSLLSNIPFATVSDLVLKMHEKWDASDSAAVYHARTQTHEIIY